MVKQCLIRKKLHFVEKIYIFLGEIKFLEKKLHFWYKNYIFQGNVSIGLNRKVAKVNENYNFVTEENVDFSEPFIF